MREARLLRTIFVSWVLFVGGACGQLPVVDSSAVQVYEAHATAVSGTVTRTRDEQPWVVSAGERVPIRQEITTGRDGYARFDVAGGSNFELFSNSKVVFRDNAASAGDLLDIEGGRVRVHFKPTLGQPQQRIFTPVATIAVSQHEPVTLAIAIDEDENVRIDVLEGEIRVQHTVYPKVDPVVVRAVDAILVQKDQPISRRMDRGSLYRYALKLKDALSPKTSGHHNWQTDFPDGSHFVEEGSTVVRLNRPLLRPLQ